MIAEELAKHLLRNWFRCYDYIVRSSFSTLPLHYTKFFHCSDFLLSRVTVHIIDFPIFGAVEGPISKSISQSPHLPIV